MNETQPSTQAWVYTNMHSQWVSIEEVAFIDYSDLGMEFIFDGDYYISDVKYGDKP
jgi:hypothetical protein